MSIVIIDIGIGNIKSVANALNYLKINFSLTDNLNKISDCNYLILPGVGSFDGVIGALERKNLIQAIKKHILIKKKPFLGICVGMQILFQSSEEGKKKGLEIFNGKIEKLNFEKKNKNNKVPNVGFREVFGYKRENIFKELNEIENFYFTHSYALNKIENDESFNIAYCQHNKKFISGLNFENVYGVQFHPEKSQSTGLKLIKNFLEI